MEQVLVDLTSGEKNVSKIKSENSEIHTSGLLDSIFV